MKRFASDEDLETIISSIKNSPEQWAYDGFNLSHESSKKKIWGRNDFFMMDISDDQRCLSLRQKWRLRKALNWFLRNYYTPVNEAADLAKDIRLSSSD